MLISLIKHKSDRLKITLKPNMELVNLISIINWTVFHIILTFGFKQKQ